MRNILYFLTFTFGFIHAQNNDPVFIRTGEQFQTNTFTNYSYGCASNLFSDNEKNLHLSYVDNYKLYYSYSNDEGLNWETEQIITGFEGKIKNAGIVVNSEGKVFVPFEIHPDYNYGLSPLGYPQFIYQIFCATKNGNNDWQFDLILSNNVGSNQGSNLGDVLIDANNNVHVISYSYGWITYGGEIKETIYNSETENWNTESVVNYNDAPIDNFSLFARAAINPNGDVAIIYWRTHFNRYEYTIKQAGDSWQTPKIFDSNPTFRGFSLYASPYGDFHIVWIKGNDPYIALHKKGFDAEVTDTIYQSESGVTISPSLHIDQAARLTLVLSRSGTNPALIFLKEQLPNEGPWNLSESVFPSSSPITGLFPVKHQQGLFSHYQTLFIKYLRQGSNGPHGPDELYFWQNYNIKELTLITNPTGFEEYVSGSGEYKIDSEITISANTPENYDFVSWTDEGGEILSEEKDFTFFMPYKNITITANYVFNVSINELLVLEQIDIYPNPSSGIFNLRTNEKYMYNLLDISGRILMSGRISDEQHIIDLQGKSSGVYFLELINNNRRINKRLIIR
jgi:hypothetical protein